MPRPATLTPTDRSDEAVPRALAGTMPRSAAKLNDAYASGVAPLKEIIEEMRPDLPADACTALAMLVAAALNSFIIYAGYRKTYEPWAPAFMRIAAKAYVDLVKRVTAEEIGALPTLRTSPRKRRIKAVGRRS